VCTCGVVSAVSWLLFFLGGGGNAGTDVLFGGGFGKSG